MTLHLVNLTGKQQFSGAEHVGTEAEKASRRPRFGKLSGRRRQKGATSEKSELMGMGRGKNGGA